MLKIKAILKRNEEINKETENKEFDLASYHFNPKLRQLTHSGITQTLSPRSRMDILSEREIDDIVSKSEIANKYNQSVDSQSAYEILTDKLNEAAERSEELQRQKQEEKQTRTTTKKEKGFFDDPVVKSMTRTAGNTIVRSLLGALGLGGRSRRRSLF